MSDVDTLDALPYRRTKLLYAWADWAAVDVLCWAAGEGKRPKLLH